LHEFGREGDLHLQFFMGGERSRPEFADVFGRVDEQNILIGSRARRQEVGRFGYAGFEEAIANAPIFFSGKNVSTNGKVIIVAVDKLEGEHASTRGRSVSTQPSKFSRAAAGNPMIRACKRSPDEPITNYFRLGGDVGVTSGRRTGTIAPRDGSAAAVARENTSS